ncbi:methyltransferase domain-containing protein [Croceiramulus getboli]|nr:class I SAM-dependent methyltransferase [Flavobacteriaceae bacterium YJPT1-3]
MIELGFGDGNQLEYFNFPSYLGFDVSEVVIENCRQKFKEQSHMRFQHVDIIADQKAELVLSLDVIYHLIEDQVYHKYMNQLFDLSERYVIIYAYDSEDAEHHPPHVKPRKFTQWIQAQRPNFKLIQHIPNRYPYNEKKPKKTSFADFYIYERED